MSGSARQRRRWTSTLAAPVPAGPDGQPAHAAGAEVTVIDIVEVPDVGPVSMSVPRPSALLLGQAEDHLRKARRLRLATKNQVGRGRWVQPGHELKFTNEDLVLDFFEHAMAGVVLAHTSLDNLLNELLPEDFTWTSPEGKDWEREQIEASVGFEKRLTQIAAAATGKRNLRSADPDLFDRAMRLKSLRDDLGHAKRSRGYGGPSAHRTIFTDLFAVDFDDLARVPLEVADHYG